MIFGRNLFMLIYEILESGERFTEIDRMIADYLLSEENELESLSARDIAKQLFISPSALTRFCQKIGFDGFNDFRKGFLEEKKYLSTHFQRIDPNYPFVSNDSDFIVSNKISEVYQEAVRDCAEMIDYHTLEKVSQILEKADVIYIGSAGMHIHLAEVFLEKMARIGKTVVLQSHTDVLFHSASSCSLISAFILISYSGETESLTRSAVKLKERGIPLIAITSYGPNTLSEISDYVFFMSTREKLVSCIGNYCPYVSVLFLLDTLYSCVFRKNYTRNLKRKVADSKEYQKNRRSANPILRDE